MNLGMTCDQIKKERKKEINKIVFIFKFENIFIFIFILVGIEPSTRHAVMVFIHWINEPKLFQWSENPCYSPLLKETTLI